VTMSISRSPSDAVRRILRTARRAPDMVHNAGAAHTPGGQARSRPIGRSRGQRPHARAFQDCQHRRMRAARATLVTGQDGVATRRPGCVSSSGSDLRQGGETLLNTARRGSSEQSAASTAGGRKRVSQGASERVLFTTSNDVVASAAVAAFGGRGQHANLSLEGLVVARWQGCRGRSASVGEFRLD
jgi:hypothetical protein